jgi:hypothetical protein
MRGGRSGFMCFVDRAGRGDKFAHVLAMVVFVDADTELSHVLINWPYCASTGCMLVVAKVDREMVGSES